MVLILLGLRGGLRGGGGGGVPASKHFKAVSRCLSKISAKRMGSYWMECAYSRAASIKFSCW